MKHLTHVVRALLGVAMVFSVTSAVFLAPSFVTPALQRADPSSTAAILEAYGQLPLSFEANQGQTDEQVKFLSRGSGYNLFLTPTEAVLALSQAAATEPKDTSELVPAADVLEAGQPIDTAVLRLQLVQANPAPQVMGLEELPGKVNYFLSNDPAEWRMDIPTYAKVAYQEVYPGVDLVYYGHQRQLEYDFIVAPGADPGSITLGFEGADPLAVDAQGDLVLRTGGGEIRQLKPVVYQEVNGARMEVAGSYVLKDTQQVGFQVGAYDTAMPLVIDPMLVYSTFLGGSGNDRGFGIVVDAAGNAYVVVRTESTNFPTAGAPFQSANAGNADISVTKLNSSGSGLVYSTYLGGSGNDGNCCLQLTIDASGNAYVTGDTTSTDFPTTSGAFQTAFAGGADDAFVTKMNSTGSALVYSTYLGGSSDDAALDIAVDSAGNAYVIGGTSSLNFPTTTGALQVVKGGGGGVFDAFVTKLNGSGSALAYSTYLGGSSPDSGASIAVDSAGNAYVTGFTASTDFPTTAGAFDTSFNGGRDTYVAKLNSSGSSLVYSTYLGASANDDPISMAIESAGDAYVTGETNSTNFPTTSGAFQTTLVGGREAFVTKLNATGSTLVYSTYLGGSGTDVGVGIAVDGGGNAYLTGSTESTNFPTTSGAIQTAFGGGVDDVFVTKLNPSGSALVFSTYLGGSGFDQGTGIAVDNASSVYVTGGTSSTNFPTTSGAFQTAFGGGTQDAFVTKLGDALCFDDDDGQDDDDFDDDCERGDEDDDDDNDGKRDDRDDDDDNDGRRDNEDDDDDNDGISDEFDNEATRERSASHSAQVAGGRQVQYPMAADANTVLLTAVAVDGLALTAEIYDPQGVLIGSSLPLAGRAIVIALPTSPGNYTVRVRNITSTTVTSLVTLIRSDLWP